MSRHTLKYGCIGLIVSLLAACFPYIVGPAPSEWHPSASEQHHPLSENVAWVAQSPVYIQRAQAAYASALSAVDRASRGMAPQSWGVVLDLDQTVLNNIEYQAALDRRGAKFTPETWRGWVEARRATPVPGAVGFIHHVRGLGGQVAFVTNRRDYEVDATKDNLAALGLEEGRDYQLILPRAWPDGAEDKDARFRTVPRLLGKDGRNVRILAYLGDAAGDEPGFAKEAFFCIPQGHLYGTPCDQRPNR